MTGRRETLAALGITVHQGDLRDEDSIRPSLSGVETVFHTAARVGIGSSPPQQSVNRSHGSQSKHTWLIAK